MAVYSWPEPTWLDDECQYCGRSLCDGGADCLAAGAPDTKAAPSDTPSDELDGLEDATTVIAEGKLIAEAGVPYLLDGIVPAYGMFGMNIAFAKVGKTTWGQQLAAAVAMDRPFLGRHTQRRRVLVLAAEDPAEYTAYLARVLDVDPHWLTFRRKPLQLTPPTLARLARTIQRHHYGLVLIASWQAVVRTLVKDENDNAGAVRVVEAVKEIAHGTGVPWLADAHSGKGEDQRDDADPAHALRGASGAAGAADYLLSLRYANGPFGTQRRLSGKGRFVNFPPLTLGMDTTTGLYSLVGEAAKKEMAETTWALIEEMGALATTPQTAAAIAKAAGLWDGQPKTRMTACRKVTAALFGREGVGRLIVGKQTKYFREEGL